MRAAIWILALGLSACHSSSPTAPTPPPAPPVSPLPPASSIVSISVTGGSWIVMGGAPLQMHARVYTGTGQTDFVDGTGHVAWSVDPPAGAAVDRLGRLTASAPGAFVVIATAGDTSGRTTVRSVPDYTGHWSGDFIVTGCSGAVDFRDCSRIMFSGGGLGVRNQYPFTLALSQLQDQVTGSWREIRSFGDLTIPLRGFVRVSGALVLEASMPQADLAPLQIVNWSSTVNPASTAMSGAFTKVAPMRRSPGLLYTLRTEQEFSNIPRVQ